LLGIKVEMHINRLHLP